ncbi:MAG: ABC transporter ATP-binding protein [Nanoarchaeota archaeon]|nr:ABC transporter ATP-binding protein [Nanoarchaeota archaeon]
MITCNNLSKNYGQLKAVDDLSLEIKQGELFGLLGPNGAGKSTLIKLLTGQVKPSSGTAEVMGISISYPVKLREEVGIIPEQENPPSFLTAEEYLRFVAGIRKLGNVTGLVDKWISFFEMESNRRSLCKDLSRGTRQKLMIAQAFLHEPKLAFIDEPLTNLDPISQRKVKDFLIGYVKEGNTIFFCTHTLDIAHEICTRVCIIDKGRIILEKRGNEIKRQNLETLFLKAIQNE